MLSIVLVQLALHIPLSAQRMKILSGSLKGLKGQKSYNILFRYDSMLVGNQVLEEVYLADMKNRWETREPGKGDYFVKLWFDARQESYEPTFIKSFERYSTIKLGDSQATYTLLVKTKYTEGGWDAGVLSYPGEISGEVWIVESADHNKVLAKIGFYNFQGNNSYGRDIDMTTRIKPAYALAGKGLGYFIKGKAKK